MRQSIDKGRIEKIRDALEKDDNVVFALLFGSYIRGKKKKGSDIDIAIYFRKPPGGYRLLKIIDKLSSLTGNQDVDLIILNNASAMMRHQVFKNKETIVIKDRDLYTRFRLKSMNDYEEFKHISGLDIYDG